MYRPTVAEVFTESVHIAPNPVHMASTTPVFTITGADNAQQSKTGAAVAATRLVRCWSACSSCQDPIAGGHPVHRVPVLACVSSRCCVCRVLVGFRSSQLAFSAPTHPGGGRVYVLPLHLVQSGDTVVTALNTTTVLASSERVRVQHRVGMGWCIPVTMVSCGVIGV